MIASVVVIVSALLFCIDPAVVVGALMAGPQMKRAGQSCLAPMGFKS